VDLVSLACNIDQRLTKMYLGTYYPNLSDGLWDPKVFPHSFKEDFSNGFYCDILLVGHHNGHLE